MNLERHGSLRGRAQQVADDDAVGRIRRRRLVGRQRRVGVLVPAEAPRRRRPEQKGRARDVGRDLPQRRDVVENPEAAAVRAATTRSSSLITRSRIDVAGMFSRSDCQCSPSSNDT